MPYSKKDRPFWYFDFWIKDRRFFGTLTDEAGRPLARTERRRRAEEREAVERASAREQIGAGRQKQRMTLDQALGRYWTEYGQHLPSAGNIWTYSDNWRRIGRGARPLSLLKKSLDQLSNNDMSWYVSMRRGEEVRNQKPRTLDDGTVVRPPLVAPRTVNADVEFLRDMMSYAATNWDADIGEKPLNWDDLLLDVQEAVTRALTAEEDERLFAAIDKVRPDFRDLMEFAVLSGWRLSEIYKLEKSRIDRHAMMARITVKGGREVVKTLTVQMLGIIERNWMHHPTRVFTYIRHHGKTYIQKGVRVVARKGQRMPFTKNGWRKQWKAILKEAEIGAFRFHDFRHTLGTRVYFSTRDRKAVQRALSHKDPKSSDRYVHEAGVFERQDLEAAAALRVPTKSRPSGAGGGQNSGGAAG